ncbi:uncharacterized protein LOC111405784 [Olea europaea var. sylvestris]|uniref:uncharacterized protein LOC111405784 n=1 Tax=Olea europaea var. sylvestris TaxID=158386 RepID=UPI000C1D1032|nr:uncharacterized protein LOC111405784 [Olea europaea var. sylvestris]
MGNKDRKFCVSCSSVGSFVKDGFSNWKKKEYIRKHIGVSSSAHNQARVKYEVFKNKKQSIRTYLVKQSHQARTDYRIRLNASIDCIKAVAFTNTLENSKLTSPRVQKDIVSAITSECLHVIIKYVRDSFFSILVYESQNISVKEQKLVVVRYVKNGGVLEHFIGIIHVSSTTVASLKAVIDQLFSIHSLNISNLRGQ